MAGDERPGSGRKSGFSERRALRALLYLMLVVSAVAFVNTQPSRADGDGAPVVVAVCLAGLAASAKP